MLAGMDLQQIFMFPVKDAEARKHFLIGCLVSLAGFIIPILPFLALYGYGARIAKQILNDEAPHMTPWDDWGGMFKDGARMFGIRMIYAVPILILLVPVILGSIAFPIVLENSSSANTDSIIALFMVIMFGAICLIIPLSLPLAVIIPAAEMHVLDKNEFGAGLRIKEWWAILRANLSGFIAAFAIFYIASFILTFALQIIMATIILSCLLFILMPALTTYLTIIMYVTIAQAYKVGKEKVSQNEIQLKKETLIEPS